MEICYTAEGLQSYLEQHVKADQEHPLLLDRFLEDAIEVDVDALADGDRRPDRRDHAARRGGRRPLGRLGVRAPADEPGRGDARRDPRDDRAASRCELGVIGLINIQYAVAGGKLYVIEANPRASRTVPFVSKAIGAPLAKIACRLMLGERLADQELPPRADGHVSVKEAVLPFARFAGRRLRAGAGDEVDRRGDGHRQRLPDRVRQGAGGGRDRRCRPRAPSSSRSPTPTSRRRPSSPPASTTSGFEVIATRGTAQAISRMGVPVTAINKIGEGSPHVVDYIRNGEVDIVINTPTGSGARSDGYEIRNAAVRHGIPCVTTMTGASAAVRAIAARAANGMAPRSAFRSFTGSASAARRAEGTAGSAPRDGARSLAPAWAAARARSSDERETGGYRVFSALDADGPEPARRPVLHARRGAGLGARPGRPYLPRAFSVAEAESREDGVGSTSWSRPIGPGTERLAALERRRAALASTGPLGRPLLARRASWPRAAGAILVGGGIGIAPLAILRRRAGGARGPDPHAARLPRPGAFRGLRALRLLRGRARDRGRPRRTRGYVTDLLAVLLEGDDAERRRRLRLRATGDARGGAARCALSARSPPSSPWRRRWRAASAPASAARSRWPSGGYMRLCVDGPVVSAAEIETALVRGIAVTDGSWRGRARRPRARASGPERVGDVRRDRRPARLRRCAAERVPVLAFVSKTITPEPRAGNPPPG